MISVGSVDNIANLAYSSRTSMNQTIVPRSPFIMFWKLTVGRNISVSIHFLRWVDWRSLSRRVQLLILRWMHATPCPREHQTWVNFSFSQREEHASYLINWKILRTRAPKSYCISTLLQVWYISIQNLENSSILPLPVTNGSIRTFSLSSELTLRCDDFLCRWRTSPKI